MVRRLLLPLIWSFKGLFLTMTLACFLAIGIFSGLGSAITNLEQSYSHYLEDYRAPDLSFSFDFTFEADLDVKDIDGVKGSSNRLSLDGDIKTNEGKSFPVRLSTYETKDHTLYFHTEISEKEGIANVYVSKGFATYHGVAVGQEVELGYFGCYFPAYISALVDAPETLYARQNAAIWSDGRDFGLLYLEKSQISVATSSLAKSIDARRNADPDFKAAFDDYLKVNFGVAPSDLSSISRTLGRILTSMANELWVYVEEAANQEICKEKVEERLRKDGVSLISSSYRAELPYDSYLTSAISQLKTISLYLPIFFCIVTLVIIALFTRQIIIRWSRQIGILSSLGIDKSAVLLLFSCFALSMCLLSGVLGSLLGGLLSWYVSGVFAEIYAIPLMMTAFHPLLALASFGILCAVGQVATLFACLSIFSLSPVEAIGSNVDRRHENPRWVDKIIARRKTGMGLALSSIFQNKGRFLASSISMMAATAVLLVCSLFLASKDELVRQTATERLDYDCQVYFSERVDESLYREFAAQSFIEMIEPAEFAFLEVSSDHGSATLETIGLIGNERKLIHVPSPFGNSEQEYSGQGIVLPSSIASSLDVKTGDSVSVNGAKIMVSSLSRQYFHYQGFLTQGEMLEAGVDSVSTFFVNTNDEAALRNYLSDIPVRSMVVSSSALSEDLYFRYGGINALLIILMTMALALTLAILSMMTLNALLERKRSISILRCLGMNLMEVGQSFFFQGIIELILALAFGLPSAILVASALLKSMSSASLTYPLLLGFAPFAFSIGVVALVLVASLLSSLISIRKWNLSDNLRAKE